MATLTDPPAADQDASPSRVMDAIIVTVDRYIDSGNRADLEQWLANLRGLCPSIFPLLDTYTALRREVCNTKYKS